jgi:hypothetical protein
VVRQTLQTRHQQLEEASSATSKLQHSQVGCSAEPKHLEGVFSEEQLLQLVLAEACLAISHNSNNLSPSNPSSKLKWVGQYNSNTTLISNQATKIHMA